MILHGIGFPTVHNDPYWKSSFFALVRESVKWIWDPAKNGSGVYTNPLVGKYKKIPYVPDVRVSH